MDTTVNPRGRSASATHRPLTEEPTPAALWADACAYEYRKGCPREVFSPKGKLGENLATFSSGVIKTRTRRLSTSLSSSREQDREINGLIDAPGTRSPSVARQMIESAAESEIGPTPPCATRRPSGRRFAPDLDCLIDFGEAGAVPHAVRERMPRRCRHARIPAERAPISNKFRPLVRWLPLIERAGENSHPRSFAIEFTKGERRC